MALQSCKKDNEDRIVGDWVRDCTPFLPNSCPPYSVRNFKEDGTLFLHENDDCKKGSIISGSHYYEIKSDTLIINPGIIYQVDTFIIEELTRRKLTLNRVLDGHRFSSSRKYRKCRWLIN